MHVDVSTRSSRLTGVLVVLALAGLVWLFFVLRFGSSAPVRAAPGAAHSPGQKR